MKKIREFWKDETGDDLVSYSLMVAFLAVLGAALFLYSISNAGPPSVGR